MTPPDELPEPAWPPHHRATRRWQQALRGQVGTTGTGTRDDRMLREVTVWMPPMIADQDIGIDSPLAADLESAMLEIASLDGIHGADLEALGVLLLRTESVASSKIEAVEAGVDDYARALHGIRSNPSAVSMVAATTALVAMISDVDRHGRIELAAITSASCAR